MKLYKIFDMNANYPSYWCEDHEVELRSFNTREINSQEYQNWNSEDYFQELSRLEKKFVLRELDDDWSEWVES